MLDLLLAAGADECGGHHAVAERPLQGELRQCLTARGGDAEYLARLRALCRAVLGTFPSLPAAADAARVACLDKKNTRQGSVVLTVPFRRGEFRLMELSAGEYEGELSRIGRTL